MNSLVTKTNPTFSTHKILVSLFKIVAIPGLIVLVVFTHLSNNSLRVPSKFYVPLGTSSQPFEASPTNISHIVFGLCGSVKAWRNRKSYIEAWWRPNVTRGYIFLDNPPSPELLPWPSSSPPFRVSEDTSEFNVFSKHIAPSLIRIVRTVLEVFREGDEGVRWYIMGDDDTIFFVDNLVEVLTGYDHTKYFYIGGISECTKSNFDFSFEMAYGGGGFAMSYPLVAGLVKNLDDCIKRYPYYAASDRILSSCIADFGVSLTSEKGFHQIDLQNDISGLLSAHPQSPLLSLHHLDTIDPIFPTMNRHKSINHLMKAANVDQSCVLQQTICYHKPSNWSFSIAWGYAVHIYEQVYPRSILTKPLATFRPWNWRSRPPYYMFDTRPVSSNPCEAPHIFFFRSIHKDPTRNQIVTSYVRPWPRGLPGCSSSGNHSADYTSEMLVISPAAKFSMDENRGLL